MMIIIIIIIISFKNSKETREIKAVTDGAPRDLDGGPILYEISRLSRSRIRNVFTYRKWLSPLGYIFFSYWL